MNGPARLIVLGPLAALALLASANASASVWTNLWWRPDQQGERLLRAGHAAQAADRFSDPRRRAYAELEAGRYGRAAKLLAPFHDAESLYNRGNALTHEGQLSAALGAYDAALKRAPGDRDIRHNRDLVARALQRRQRKAQSRGSRGSTHRAAPHPGSRSAHGRPGGSHTFQGKPGRRSAQGPQRAAPPGKAGSAAEAAARAAAAAADGRRDEQSGQRGPGRLGQLQRAQHTATRPPKPPSEKRLSLEQWLRSIPDDPAGLLRRKFLIERLMRERRAQP